MKKTTVKTRNPVVQLRKIMLSLSFILIVAASSASESSEPAVNEKVEASFKKEFAGAQLVSWTDMGEFLKATFIFGNHRTEAYFRENGQLEGTMRSLFYSQLPLLVMTSVDKRFENAEIGDVTEINNASGTTYRIMLELKFKKYQIKVDANGNFQGVERIKK